LYDEDCSGAIDVEEMTLMLKDVYGKRALSNNKSALHVLNKIKVLGGGLTSNDVEVSYPVFLDFCNKHPALLFPAFHLQLTLQTKIIGRRFWEGLERKRDKVQRKAAKQGDQPDKNPDEVNFRDVMKFLADLNEDDREDALNAAMEEAVDAIDDTFKVEASAQAQREISRLKTMAQTEAVRGGGRSSGSSGRRSGRGHLKRSNTTGSSSLAARGGPSRSRKSGSAYSVKKSSSSDAGSTNTPSDLGGSLMSGGKSWKCRTCKRTNYPKHSRCQTCRKPRSQGVGRGGSGGGPGKRQQKEIDWASSGL
jgi:hypothetical protein